MVFNVNMAVAHHARGKRHKVTDHTIVLDIAVKVGMEMLANTDVAGQRDEGTQDRAHTQLNIVELHHIGRSRLKKPHPIGRTALNQLFADTAIGYRHVDLTAAGGLKQPLRIRQNPVAIHHRRWRVVVYKNQITFTDRQTGLQLLSHQR
jgi:hypothetical protein